MQVILLEKYRVVNRLNNLWIFSALKELGALRADLFIISWPVGLNLDQTMELWNVMETLVDHNQADSLGVSDIETQAFIQLHSLARVLTNIAKNKFYMTNITIKTFYIG